MDWSTIVYLQYNELRIEYTAYTEYILLFLHIYNAKSIGFTSFTFNTD